MKNKVKRIMMGLSVAAVITMGGLVACAPSDEELDNRRDALVGRFLPMMFELSFALDDGYQNIIDDIDTDSLGDDDWSVASKREKANLLSKAEKMLEKVENDARDKGCID